MLFKTAAIILSTAGCITTGVSATPTPAPAAVSCAVCPKTIVYAGVTRTVTLKRESTSWLQCNYDSPAISGFSPYCVYTNVGGSLYYTNTGGACPAVAQTISSTSACSASNA